VSETELRQLVYCNFTDPTFQNKNYEEVRDLNVLRTTVEYYVTEYNQINKNQLDLVLFRYALEHLSRISRIISQPRGHALLVGLEGTGRQSLTRLAAYISQYELFQV